MGDYDGKTVYFECTMKDLRNPDKYVDIAWVVNSGEVKVDYILLKLISNIREEKLRG